MDDQTARWLGRRSFLRSAALIGTGAGMSAVLSACSDRRGITQPALDVDSSRKWVRLDAVDGSSGDFLSVEGFTDSPENPFSVDFPMSGYTVSRSGQITPVVLALDKDTAGSVALVPIGGDAYRLVLDGVAQPPGAPYEIHMVERIVEGTNVTVLTGASIDPSTGKVTLFSVTHDPLPALIIGAIAIGIIAIAAGIALRIACGNQPGRIRVHGTSVSIECGHNQGGGG